MKYELAKKLKDAGFPQKESSYFSKDETPDGGSGVADVYKPTLGELIEACGDDLWVIRRGMYKGESGWAVGKDTNASTNPIDWEIFIFNQTLEIAVANLWLRLNTK